MSTSDFISTIFSSPYNKVKNLRNSSGRIKALFALSVVCVLWGTTWIASRQGVQYMPALQLSGIRQFCGGLIYVVYFLSKGKRLPRGKEWWSILLLSLLNFILSNGLATWGVKYISAGLGAIIAAIFPLWLVVIGLFNAKSKMPVAAVLGLMLGFLGICVIFYEHLHDFLNADFRFGILISVIATWTWAFGTLYTKEHADTFNPYFGIGLQMLISGIVLYASSYTVKGMNVNISSIPWQAWLAIGYLVVFGSVIAFMAYIYALQNLPMGLVSVYAYMNPVVAVIFGWLLFEEKLTSFIAIGGAVTLFGVFLVNNSFRKQRLAREAETMNNEQRAMISEEQI